MKKINVDWMKVERLVLKSFTGSELSQSELSYLQLAYYSEPEEYKIRSSQIRESERSKIRSL